MSERDFTKLVVEIARRFGWRVVHFLPARVGKDNRPVTAYLGDGKGFPDIVAVRERMLYAELKVPPNRQTVEQRDWAQAITGIGGEFYLWTPDDLDELTRVLSGVGGRPSSGVQSTA